MARRAGARAVRRTAAMRLSFRLRAGSMRTRELIQPVTQSRSYLWPSSCTSSPPCTRVVSLAQSSLRDVIVDESFVLCTARRDSRVALRTRA